MSSSLEASEPTSNGADVDTNGTSDEPPLKRQRILEPESIVVLNETPVQASKEDEEESQIEHSLAFRLSQIEPGTLSSESSVGINSYVNPDLPAFEHAVIKHRFTDFLVWEITREGEVVRLHDISRPATVVAAPTSTSTPENAIASTSGSKEGQQADNDPKPDLLPNLEDFMSKDKAQELRDFFGDGVMPANPSESLSSDAIENKDERKAFHNAIRTIFGGKLSTVAKEAGVIEISWTTDAGKERRTVRPSRQDQRDLPPYIQFTLQKTNRETQDCIGHLATMLGVPARDLTTAGTKDKRGVTTQLVTLKRGKRSIEEVWDTVNGLRFGKSKDSFRNGRGGNRGRGMSHRGGGGEAHIKEGMMPTQRGDRGIRIGDLKYVDTPLDLGMLQGNRFCIVLRDVRVPSNNIIDSAIRTLKEQGFINYYGMQRFGNSTVQTHVIGLALLKGDWKEASRLILSEKSGDSEDVIAARRAWNVDGDANEALKSIPKWAVAERCILEFYKSQGSDSNQNGALSKIPKNLRLMYVHAYQSYVWNSAVSERVRLYGCTKPIIGDLVLRSDVKEENGETSERAQDGVEVDDTVRTSKKISQESLKAASKTPAVFPLTEETVHQYTIYDVVLPLPGYTVTYPEGQISDLYRRMLKADGLDIDKLFRPQKEYSLSGQYRKMMKRPTDLEWSLIRYSDSNTDLVQPDEDKLLGFDPLISPEDGEKLAVRLEFNLDSASYATMALREVLKSETSNVNQRALTEAMLKLEEKDADVKAAA